MSSRIGRGTAGTNCLKVHYRELPDTVILT